MHHDHALQKRSCNQSVIYAVMIAGVWIIGLLVGCSLGLHSAGNGLLQMHSAAIYPASLLLLFVLLFAPFALTAICCRYYLRLLSLLVIFVKATIFACCSCCILVCFSSAGWLVRLLLLFSDSLIVVLLLWFLLRHITGDRSWLKTDIFLCAILSFIICIIDYFAVVAFSATLFSK